MAGGRGTMLRLQKIDRGQAVNFINKLSAAWSSNNSLLCVGLDPDLARLPAHLQQQPDGIFTFCKAIIDATADLACAFKPQIAYFAALGAEDQLEAICNYLRQHYPQIPLILDAVTLSPYMGFDSIEPYLAWSERGQIILCRTSNPGGSDLQFLNVDGKPLYQHVAAMVAGKWNRNGQCALVVGATFPGEMAQVRAIVGDMPLLVPGIGAQGGDIEATVQGGKTADGAGMMISSSRAILFATPAAGEDFAAAARRAALETRDAINLYR
jgi:orotidine-5'-phosphate decarboxylase